VLDRNEILHALGRLPVDHRAVIVLHYYFDLPVADAAASLGIPVGTAKSRLILSANGRPSVLRRYGISPIDGEPRRRANCVLASLAS